jgi:hypothetical protein
MAADHALRRELSRRVRDDLMRLGLVRPGPAVTIADGAAASPGDLIICTRNDHAVQAGEPGRPLANGDVLRIDAITRSGLVVRRALDADPATGQRRWTDRHFLFNSYKDAELGYAVTDHVAQGRTVTAGLAVITGAEDHPHALVALTRGTTTNLAYVFTRSPKRADPVPRPPARTRAGPVRQQQGRTAGRPRPAHLIRPAWPGAGRAGRRPGPRRAAPVRHPGPAPRPSQRRRRRAFADSLGNHQSLMVPAADPDYGDLGQAFPPWPAPARQPILQPPRPLDDAEMTRCDGVERAGIDRILPSRNPPPAWTTRPPYAGRAPQTVPRSPQALSQHHARCAGQLRNEVIAAVKKAGSSSHGKCAAPGWTVTVAFGKSPAAAAAVAGVGLASSSPAYTSTGAASRAASELVAAGLNAPAAPSRPVPGGTVR